MPPRTVPLVKAHAYGNDFLLVAADRAPAALAPDELARRACDRHRGMGADGLILVRPTSDGCDTELFNADGSRSEVSGNGIRCVGAWLAEERALGDGAQLAIQTGAGPRPLTLLGRQGVRTMFRAGMGVPEDLHLEQLDVNGVRETVVVMRVGNPQCVVLGPATPDRLRTLGGPLATHPFFPAGTNVELAHVERPDVVRILIWERGVGPTEASGTGACAAAVAAAAYGGAARSVDVRSPGGTQRVEWTREQIWLTGWAELVGRIEWLVE